MSIENRGGDNEVTGEISVKEVLSLVMTSFDHSKAAVNSVMSEYERQRDLTEDALRNGLLRKTIFVTGKIDKVVTYNADVGVLVDDPPEEYSVVNDQAITVSVVKMYKRPGQDNFDQPYVGGITNVDWGKNITVRFWLNEVAWDFSKQVPPQPAE